MNERIKDDCVCLELYVMATSNIRSDLRYVIAFVNINFFSCRNCCICAMCLTFSQTSTRGSVMCVYQLFAKLQAGNAGGQGYCLALLASDDGTLDLFLNEVEAFMRSHANKLANAEKYLPDETRDSLKDWHRQSTLFIGRVLRGIHTK